MARTSKCRARCARKFPKYARASLTEPCRGCGGDYCEIHLSKAPENIDKRYTLSDDSEIDGIKWKSRKIKAMDPNYADELWFINLTKEDKQKV